MTGATSKRTTSDEVHGQLRAAILGGEYAAGDALPSERVLSEELAVSRHVVREAIKRLLQAGLVEVAHGGATRVRDWRTSGGLELLVDLALAGGAPPELLRSVAELRTTIGADAARLAAARASEVERASLRLLAAQVAEADAASLDRLERYEELWEQILACAQNIAYRLAYNSLVAARGSGAVDPSIYARELADPAAIVAFTGAIVAGDAQRAYDLSRDLLDRTVASL